MSTSSLIIKSKDADGKNLQKTITYVNPNVSAATIAQFAQMLNGITTNEYVKSSLIDNTDIDNEERPGTPTPTTEKETPELEIFNVDGSREIYVVEYDGDGELFVHATEDCHIDLDEPKIEFALPPTQPFEVYASEGENYKAAKATFSPVNN